MRREWKTFAEFLKKRHRSKRNPTAERSSSHVTFFSKQLFGKILTFTYHALAVLGLEPEFVLNMFIIHEG
ncbi:MAG: hypothetical protein CVU61_09370 [Deltaproteobacteria bacterium HGW-Deltaproteobacteria-19]|nr:MAG: hypothetical protein CVU61_09370 [Deltaproteobacteria bacterium HGW-Deltaproteobacteria-19]